jgi:hypothetical protein
MGSVKSEQPEPLLGEIIYLVHDQFDDLALSLLTVKIEVSLLSLVLGIGYLTRSSD